MMMKIGVKEEEPLRVRIFTDGACSENPGPGGWAAVFNTENKCATIQGHEQLTTNNRMEPDCFLFSAITAICSTMRSFTFFSP